MSKDLVLFEVGYVARAHGIRGEVGVRMFDPGSEALERVESVTLRSKSGEERAMAIESLRPANDQVLVRFAGVASRTDAERLVGSRVVVPRDALAPPEEGEYFQGDLVGLEAVDEAGHVLGRVAEVFSSGPVPNLVIRGGAEELWVPFADEFVPEVDLKAGRVIVRKPELIE